MRMLVKVEDLSVPRYGKRPEDRTTEELLAKAIVNVDKPQGPTSHQVSAWVRDILGAKKAAHGGTLDPRVTGVLPIALNSAVRALDALHVGDKEYVAVMRLHQDINPRKLAETIHEFIGEIYQTPPVRAAVKRELRTRRIHALEILEMEGRDVLFKVRCEAGTYIRTLCVDIGEALGVGTHMQDLRRTRTASFREDDSISVSDLRDALIFWREEGDERLLREMLRPMERLLDHLPRIVVKDTAVSALCHGANLTLPGVLEVSEGVAPGDLMAIFTRRGEGVALAKALVTSEEMARHGTGIAAKVNRVLMEADAYPKLWK